MATELLYGPDQRGKPGMGDGEGLPSYVDKCGTYAGYQEHYKQGGKPCGPCMHAQTVYVGQWRVRNGKTKNALVPYHVLGALLSAAATEVEEMAEAVLGDAVVTRAVELWHRSQGGPVLPSPQHGTAGEDS